CLSISNKRLEGYEKALFDNQVGYEPINIICGNDSSANYKFIKNVLSDSNRPDGMLATVEKLTTDMYLVCKELKLSIPKDVKIVSFSNLSSASILNPSLTTVTQPAFDMGKAAAIVLFKSLEKKNFTLHDECLTIPSELIIRGSTLANA
ncbi:MAG: substrate-binding domain-containing protein, partial [Sediminibacterium sp.]